MPASAKGFAETKQDDYAARTTEVTVHQAKTHLSRLLAQVEAGGSVVITRPANRWQGSKRSRCDRSRGFLLLDVTVRQAAHADNMAGNHKDPFDRMLIVQALLDDLTLVSNETRFDRFGVNRLW